MVDQVTPALTQSSAARAFEDLRGEVSLLRRALEGLTAERRDAPDYGPTLEALITSNEQIREWARKVSERPALRLTPEQIGEQIEAVASRFRQQDRQEFGAAEVRLDVAANELKAMKLTARTAYEQARWMKLVGGMCFVGGLLVTPLLAYIEVALR